MRGGKAGRRESVRRHHGLELRRNRAAERSRSTPTRERAPPTAYCTRQMRMVVPTLVVPRICSREAVQEPSDWYAWECLEGQSHALQTVALLDLIDPPPLVPIEKAVEHHEGESKPPSRSHRTSVPSLGSHRRCPCQTGARVPLAVGGGWVGGFLSQGVVDRVRLTPRPPAPRSECPHHPVAGTHSFALSDPSCDVPVEARQGVVRWLLGHKNIVPLRPPWLCRYPADTPARCGGLNHSGFAARAIPDGCALRGNAHSRQLRAAGWSAAETPDRMIPCADGCGQPGASWPSRRSERRYVVRVSRSCRLGPRERAQRRRAARTRLCRGSTSRQTTA